MIDYHLAKKRLFSEEFVSVLKKYAVILAVMLLLRSATYMLLPVISAMFSIKELAYYNVGLSGSLYLMNLITAIIIYFDMNRLNIMSWSIIGLTLLSNEAGMLFFLLYLLHNSIHRDENNEVYNGDATGQV
jgi:hypothetical protein